MYKHFLLVTQPTANAQRIGWSKLINEAQDLKEVHDVRNSLSKLKLENKFSNHLIASDSNQIECIKEKDDFFKNILFVKDREAFIDLAKNNGEKLEASDIANYILSLKPMTHLKLQKILYMVYEKFYMTTNELLYTNKIRAFDHGPVTIDVFKKYYKNRAVLFNEDDDDSLIQVQDNAISPTVAKVMLSENGLQVMDIIKNVVQEYSEISAWDAVQITHRAGTAWDIAYNTFGRNTEITKEIIDEAIPT